MAALKVIEIDTSPFYYVRGDAIFHRPVQSDFGASMGFRVCIVSEGIDPAAVCALLNKAEPVLFGG
jgi:hypothetical protein